MVSGSKVNYDIEIRDEDREERAYLWLFRGYVAVSELDEADR